MLPVFTLQAMPTSRRILRVGVIALAFALLGVPFAAEVAAQNIFGTDCLPPPLSTYAGSFHAKYADGTNIYDLSNPEHSKFTGCELPTGGCTPHMFGSFVQADLAVNAGMPMMVNGPANTRIQVCFDHQNGPTRFFDTEMLQLDISGGPLLIRESPTLPSLGKTGITDLGGGSYRIDSFFDVFTELSVDGGQTWMPSTDAAGNPYAGRVMIPGTVATDAISWAKMKVLYK